MWETLPSAGRDALAGAASTASSQRPVFPVAAELTASPVELSFHNNVSPSTHRLARRLAL